MTMIYEQHLFGAVEHLARKTLRLQKQPNQGQEAHRTQNRMVDAIERSRHPNVMLNQLVESLGRRNALDVMIDREIVDFVIPPKRP